MVCGLQRHNAGVDHGLWGISGGRIGALETPIPAWTPGTNKPWVGSVRTYWQTEAVRPPRNLLTSTPNPSESPPGGTDNSRSLKRFYARSGSGVKPLFEENRIGLLQTHALSYEPERFYDDASD